MYVFAEANIDEIIENYDGVGYPWETDLGIRVDSDVLMATGIITSDVTFRYLIFYEYDDGCYAIELTLLDSDGSRVLCISRDIGFEPIDFPEDIITTSAE
jgi:hypothetical protein